MLRQNNVLDRADIVLPDFGGQARDCGLRVRLATSRKQVEAAQALRYRVFYEEMSATPTQPMRVCARDFDVFDDIADHLVLYDTAGGDEAAGVVGTYRLIRGSVVRAAGSRLAGPGFCTGTEYNISPLLQWSGEILELGRACVDPAYRTHRAIELLWQGIAAYVFAFNIGIMFGCASFPGTDPEAIEEPLACLHHRYLAPAALRPRALPERHVAMDRVPHDAIDERAAWHALPPLIKGYLRLGAVVGDGAVIDHAFNTTDVCIVARTDRLTRRYLDRYRDRLIDGGIAQARPAGAT